MNLEYVLISYGLWVLAFVIYIPWIKQKRKVFQQSLKTLKETQRQKMKTRHKFVIGGCSYLWCVSGLICAGATR